MIFAAHAEDHVIACQTNLHHHMIRGHLFQKRVRTILVNDVDTVTDAFRLRLLDGQANVETETLVRNQSRRNPARMTPHVDFREKPLEKPRRTLQKERPWTRQAETASGCSQRSRFRRRASAWLMPFLARVTSSR